jgi:hypothetical protein
LTRAGHNHPFVITIATRGDAPNISSKDALLIMAGIEWCRHRTKSMNTECFSMYALCNLKRAGCAREGGEEEEAALTAPGSLLLRAQSALGTQRRQLLRVSTTSPKKYIREVKCRGYLIYPFFDRQLLLLASQKMKFVVSLAVATSYCASAFAYEYRDETFDSCEAARFAGYTKSGGYVINPTGDGTILRVGVSTRYLSRYCVDICLRVVVNFLLRGQLK